MILAWAAGWLAGCLHPRPAGCAFDEFACVTERLCARTWAPGELVSYGPSRGDHLTVSLDASGRPTRVTWHLEMRPGQFEKWVGDCARSSLAVPGGGPAMARSRR